MEERGVKEAIVSDDKIAELLAQTECRYGEASKAIKLIAISTVLVALSGQAQKDKAKEMLDAHKLALQQQQKEVEED